MRLKKWQITTILVFVILECAVVGIGAAIVITNTSQITPLLTTANSTSIVPPQSRRGENGLPPLNQGVALEFSIDLTDGTHPIVAGKTNLPDGTLLMISIENSSPFEPIVDDKVSVNNGSFTSGIFLSAIEEGLPPGRYVADVVVPYPRVQPAKVRAIIGENGEHLTGPLVERYEAGATVSVKKDFQVGIYNDANAVYGHIECNRESTWIATNQDSLDKCLRGSLDEIYQLTMDGKRILVKCGTRARIIGRTQKIAYVQILEGEYRDYVGWTLTIFVKTQ